MEGSPGLDSPQTDQDADLNISDFATFQTSSSPPTAQSSLPSLPHADGVEDSNANVSSNIGVAAADQEVHDEPDATYTSSTPASSDDENEEEDPFFQEENPADHHSPSSRSSISSLPASVVIPDVDLRGYHYQPSLLDKQKQKHHHLNRETFDHRARTSPFRHASSVKAMLMDDDDELTPPSRRRRIISNMSEQLTDASPRSTRSSPSPTKRRTVRPSQGSAAKAAGFTKEFPLILLHCRMLPPSLSSLILPAGLRTTDDRVLRDLLPEEYFNRWKLLQDRLGGDSSTVKQRGVLIAHPKDDYDLLEERLLESLELTQPRIQDGHFMKCHRPVDGNNDDDDDDVVVAEEETGELCPDCGKPLPHLIDYNRAWEVKIYAATGLMRAGAWAAAWKEMEKIDVEIGVYLPEYVRRAIDDKLREMAYDVMEDSYLNNENEEQRKRRREVYGNLHSPGSVRSTRSVSVQPPPLEEEEVNENEDDDESSRKNSASHEIEEEENDEHLHGHRHSHDDHHHHQPLQPEEMPPSHADRRFEPDLQELVVNYITLLFRDSKNVVIAVLGILCLYLALVIPPPTTQPPRPPPGIVEVAPPLPPPPTAPVVASMSSSLSSHTPSPSVSQIVTTITECPAPSILVKTEYVTATAADAAAASADVPEQARDKDDGVAGSQKLLDERQATEKVDASLDADAGRAETD